MTKISLKFQTSFPIRLKIVRNLISVAIKLKNFARNTSNFVRNI